MRTGKVGPLGFSVDDAVFLDFETYGKGAADMAPVLATVLDMRALKPTDRARGARTIMESGALRTFVLHPGFLAAAREKRMGLLAPTAFARWLTKWQAHRRPIVGFSSHDSKVLERQLDDSVAGYVNMLPHARKWRWREFEGEVDAFNESIADRTPREQRDARHEFNRLTSFLRLARISVPRDYGAGKTTRRLRMVEEQLDERGTYSRLTPRAKASWVQVIRHNRFDVAALAELAMLMSGSPGSGGKRKPHRGRAMDRYGSSTDPS
jgi:hypothetical protein